MELITGYKGQAHVTAAQTGATNAGIFGNGQFILNVGELMEATKTDNNHVAIAEGYAINQGRYFCTTGESVTIETGTASNKREDLIVARYEKAASGVESVTLKVIKGTAGADYTTPDYVTGDILDGDTVDEMPLYKVHLIGAELEEIVRVAEIKESFGGGINLITNAEYEALSEEEQNARDYLITDLDAEPIDASVIEYDDDVSVKTALDTLNTSLSTLEVSDISVTYNSHCVQYSTLAQAYKTGKIGVISGSVYFNQAGNLSFASVDISPRNNNDHFMLYRTDGGGVRYVDFKNGSFTVTNAEANTWYAFEHTFVI